MNGLTKVCKELEPEFSPADTSSYEKMFRAIDAAFFNGQVAKKIGLPRFVARPDAPLPVAWNNKSDEMLISSSMFHAIRKSIMNDGAVILHNKRAHGPTEAYAICMGVAMQCRARRVLGRNAPRAVIFKTRTLPRFPVSRMGLGRAQAMHNRIGSPGMSRGQLLASLAVTNN